MRYFLLISTSILLLMAFKAGIPDYFPQPSTTIPDIHKDSSLIALGRSLFHDPLLSRDSSVSCASCHSQYNAFSHSDHPLSHGINDRLGKRNAPSLVNLAWQKEFMWDGSSFSLEAQALIPLTSPHEMDNTLDEIIHRLQTHATYPMFFAKAYGDPNINTSRVLNAISSYERILISRNAKYDSVKQGLASFTEQESKGYALFKQQCNACHTEPLFTNASFANNGLPIDIALNDMGRFAITQDSADIRHFKIPTLRNLLYSYPYMHDGRFKRLRDVIKHYSQNIDNSDKQSDVPFPLRLSNHEETDLLAFLHALTDKSYIFNTSYSTFQATK